MRKTLLLAAALLFSSITLLAENRAERLVKEFYNPNSKYVLVVAHRGDWRNAPENSLQAYQNSIDMGADVIEIDVRKTKDGKFVIIHDKTVNRTTNGRGKVSDMTLAEIKQLYLKSGHGIVTRHRVPTLEEVLELVKGKILVNIDKGDAYFDEIYDLLVKTGTEKQVLLKTYTDLKTVQSKSKNDIPHKSLFMATIYVEKKDSEERIKEFTTVNPVAYEICFSKESPQLTRALKMIKDSGSKIWISSLWGSINGNHDDDTAVEENKPDETWGWLLDQGASVIMTDRPAALIQYLKKKHRH